jgi:hypothetical protein
MANRLLLSEACYRHRYSEKEGLGNRALRLVLFDFDDMWMGRSWRVRPLDRAKSGFRR